MREKGPALVAQPSRTDAERLAAFAVAASFEDLADEGREQLKRHVLDAFGCALGALEGEPIGLLRRYLEQTGGGPHCSCIGGGRSSPQQAALFNSALVRYLDFNDSYFAPGETFHPSDNLGAILAAAELAGGTGADFLTAAAVAYQVQGRLSEVAPVRAKGFDHTTQGTYALATGIAKALGLDVQKTAQAIAICGTGFNALRVTRTGALSHWKGLAYPNAAFCCMHATLLARSGITGPLEVFEGNKGFKQAIAGPFDVDWEQEGLGRVSRAFLKKYNAEIHAQSAIEGILELRTNAPFEPAGIQGIDVEIFDVAYQIIGGGEEGEKMKIRTKEEADHSLPYMLAAAVLDGELTPRQYAAERIVSEDVQALLRKIEVRPHAGYSDRFPAEHACRLIVHLGNGQVITREKSGYEGFVTQPMDWDAVIRKFIRLSEPYTSTECREKLVETVRRLENVPIRRLTDLLERAKNS